MKGLRLFEALCLTLVAMLIVNFCLYEFIKKQKSNGFKLKMNFFKNKSINKINTEVTGCEKKLLGNISFIETSNYTNLFSKKISHLINIKEYEFLKHLRIGGSFKPKNCSAHTMANMALVIPFKNRHQNLERFLLNMHPFLQRQLLTYTLFVIEQVNEQVFNKGIIMNAAYLEIKKNYNNIFDCIMLHDVDLLPTDDLNIYACPKQKPIHMSILVDHHDYNKEYPNLVGGVLVFSFSHFELVNGYSNLYWGWGAEDDDMYYRLINNGVGFVRPRKSTVYAMMNHTFGKINPVPKPNPQRFELLKGCIARMKKDGLNSVQYELLEFVKYPMFTFISVDIGDQPKQLM